MSDQSTKNLRIVFGGDAHDIDADVLIESLVSYSLVTQEASAYLSPDSKVNIKIKASKEGSFELLLNVIADAGSNLFAPTNIAYVASIVGVVGGLYKFKQWLSKNGAPEVIERKDENTVKVKNNNGEITVNNNVYNIYQSSDKTRESLKKTFTKLKDAEEIEDFEIIDNDTGEEIFRAERDDFGPMSSDVGEIEQRKQREIKTSQELSVFKIVFKENHKWEFFYSGNRIYASITDKDFTERVAKGEVAFRSGDRMIADIEIVQVFNEAANVFVNDEYFITKVVRHIPRQSTTQDPLGLFEPNENDNKD